MALVGSKVKLTNYVSYLSKNGDVILNTTDGTRQADEMVIDAFDIDWRPYTISYIENYCYNDNGVPVTGSVEHTYNIQYTYQLISLIGAAYTSALYGTTYDAHYMPYFNENPALSPATRGSDEWTLGTNYYIAEVRADGKGHITNVVQKQFSTTSEKNTNTNVFTYIIGTKIDEGVISYVYSEVNHTNRGFASGEANYNPQYIIANVQLTKNGSLTYTYVDASMNTGSYSGNSLLVTYTDNPTFNADGTYTKYPQVITGISQNEYGLVSYTYSTLYLNMKGGVNDELIREGHYVTQVILEPDGTLHGEIGTFSTQSNTTSATASTTPGTAYMTGITINGQGQISYEWASIRHTNTGNQGSDIELIYSYYDTNDQKFLTNVSLSNTGDLVYTYARVRVKNAESAGVLTYLIHETITEPTLEGFSDEEALPAVVSIHFNTQAGQEGRLTYTTLDLSTNYWNVTGPTNTEVLTNHFGTYVVTGVHQNKTGKMTYSYTYIITTHTNDGAELSSAGSHIVANVGLDSDGNFTYTYRDISVTEGSYMSTKLYEINYSSPKQVLTGITQTADGQISYTYTALYTNHITEIDQIGDFVHNVSITHDGVLQGEMGNFTTSAGTESNVWSPIKPAYVRGVHLDHTGQLSYTFAYVHHTTTPTASTAISVEDAGVDVIVGVNLDDEGNFTYTHRTIIPGQASGSVTLTYITKTDAGFNNTDGYSVKWVDLDGTMDVNNDGTVDYSHLLHFTYADLSSLPPANYKDPLADTGNQIVLTHNRGTYIISSVYQYSNGRISYTYTYLNTDHSNTGVDLGNLVTGHDSHVITNVGLDRDGNFTYTYRDISMNTGTLAVPAYAPNDERTNDVKVPMAANNSNSAEHNGIRFITSLSQTADGQITYTYASIYNDPVNDYKYHDFNINSVVPYDTQTADHVAVIDGISTINGNSIEHTVSYHMTYVATKKYVDELIQTNDAMRYCGTFTVNSTTGEITFSHNTINGNINIAHSAADRSRGAVYKASAVSTYNNYEIQIGDYIISNTDDATVQIDNGWDIIQHNLNIRSAGSSALNTQDSSRVLTNTYINDSGVLSYTFGTIGVVNDVASVDNITGTTTPSNKIQSINSTSTGDVPTGYPVITGINITQNGLTTTLSYNVTNIYANTNHHSTSDVSTNPPANAETMPRVIGSINITGDGALTYTYYYLPRQGNHYETGTYWPDDTSYVVSGVAPNSNSQITTATLSIPAESNTASTDDNAPVSGLWIDMLGHTLNVTRSKLRHALPNITSETEKAAWPEYVNTISKNSITQLHQASTTTFTPAGFNVVAGFITNDTGHVIGVTGVEISDRQIKNTAINTNNTTTYCITGVPTQGVIGETYTAANLYFDGSGLTSNNLHATGNATIDGETRLNGTTYIGNANTDETYIMSKTIRLNETAGSVEFEGLDRLWGTLS